MHEHFLQIRLQRDIDRRRLTPETNMAETEIEISISHLRKQIETSFQRRYGVFNAARYIEIICDVSRRRQTSETNILV